MQIGSNMAETMKLVYVIILFLSIFLGITLSNSAFSHFIPGCKTDKDCPKFYGSNVRCRKGKCVQLG
uniref:Late nodulin domain-containing protein n=3 Tax=Medicago truncatula TaxID=3880 RepID=I3SRW1_MEDTR|nr:unknown [Medicago truncatula]